MDINYSEKELEKFETSSQGSKKINNFQKQTPKKEIPPPPNIPSILAPDIQNPPLSPKSNHSKIKFELKKPLIIGIAALIIIVVFILIAFGFSLGSKGNYKQLQSLLNNNNFPDSFHSKIEIFLKSEYINKNSFLKDLIEKLAASVSPPSLPSPPPSSSTINNQISPDEFSNFNNNQTDETINNVFPGAPNLNKPYNPYSPPQEIIPNIADNFELKLTIDSDSKLSSDKENIEKINAKVNVQLKSQSLNIQALADIIFKNNDLYFKIAPGSPLDLVASGIIDKWIKINFEEILKQFFGADYETLMRVNNSRNKKLEEKIKVLLEKTKIEDIFAIHKSKQEKINNTDTYYYELSLKKEFLSGAIFELFRILSEEIAKDMVGFNFTVDPNVFTNELKNNQEEIKKLADLYSQIPFELWLGKKDGLVYKFKLDLGKMISIIESQLPSFATPDLKTSIKPVSGSPTDSLKGYILIEYSNYGKDFEVQEPEEYKDIIEILNNFAIFTFTNSNQSQLYDPLKETRNAQRLKDIENVVSIALKEYYKKNKKYPISHKWTRLDVKNNILEKALVPKYILEIPRDPKSPEFYYAYQSDGKNYQLSARLEFYPEIKDKCDPGTKEICLYIVKNY